MLDFIKNKTVFANKYHTHSEAMIVSCFFNPQKSPYRTKAFKIFYESIKHLNHSIIECVIGDSEPELEENENIKRVYTENLLWHKESLINKVISELPKKYEYIFWIDADVIFTNLNWLVDGVNQLKNRSNIIQPFEYCIHLNKDELTPNFDVESVRSDCSGQYVRHKQMWSSFCSNHDKHPAFAKSENYDVHGHVGFAWGARREILEHVPLYDRALIGGADHIIAHAAAGQIPNCCITKSFTDNIEEVNEWSKQFYSVVKGKIGYVKGDLYHIWHGDIEKRQYLKRIQDFTVKTKNIVKKDKNGLYITDNRDDEYMKNYFKQREVSEDNSFLNSVALGYMTDNGSLGGLLGGNLAGGIIGDMFNDNDNKTHDFNGGNGGSSGGGGSDSDWNNKTDINSNSENFS